MALNVFDDFVMPWISMTALPYIAGSLCLTFISSKLSAAGFVGAEGIAVVPRIEQAIVLVKTFC